MIIKTSQTIWGSHTMKLTLKVLSLALLGAVSSFTFAEEPAAEHTVSGNISVLSSYVLRGNTTAVENTGATLQGGLDYNHALGLYAGSWTSTLDTDSYGTTNPMENNFYLGYGGSINEDVGFTVGTTYYYYYDVDTSIYDGFELLLVLNYKDVRLSAQTLLVDTGFGNSCVTYLKGTYSYILPKDLSIDTAFDIYIYDD